MLCVFFFKDPATTEIYTVLTHSFPTRRSSVLTPGRFIPDNLITMPGLEQGPLVTLRSCNCTDFDLAAARGAGYRLIDDGRGGHGRSVTMGGAKSKIMGAAGAIAGLFHAASAHAQEFADPRSEEHTSELQSLMRISYAVFCLKKKNQNQTIYCTLEP